MCLQIVQQNKGVLQLTRLRMVHPMTQHRLYQCIFTVTMSCDFIHVHKKSTAFRGPIFKKTHRSSRGVLCIPVILANVDSMDTKFGEYFLMFWRVIMLSSWYHDPLKHHETFTYPTRLTLQWEPQTQCYRCSYLHVWLLITVAGCMLSFIIICCLYVNALRYGHHKKHYTALELIWWTVAFTLVIAVVIEKEWGVPLWSLVTRKSL
jgi:hypothetical protein